MARACLLVVILAVLALALDPTPAHADNGRHTFRGTPAGSLPAGDALVAHAGARPAERNAPDAQGAQHNDSYCLTCHSGQLLQSRFDDGRPFPLFVDARELRDSAHSLLTCLTCHSDYEACPPGRTEPLDFVTYRAEATETCVRCHLAAAGDYAQSVHGEPVLAGTGQGATCNDCHSPGSSGHSVPKLSEPDTLLGRESVHENCGRCHEEELESYRQTSHYMVARFGDPERPATCTTCHGEHAVSAADDQAEPLAADRLVTVCQACHQGADETFASGWLGHTASPSRSAGFYYAERFVIISLSASVAFGMLHMTLHSLRAITDRERPPGTGRE